MPAGPFGIVWPLAAAMLWLLSAAPLPAAAQATRPADKPAAPGSAAARPGAAKPLPANLAATKPAEPPPPAIPGLAPGREVEVRIPRFNTFVTIYLPLDYTPDRAWPVILNYPGEDLKISTSPFVRVTGGKGFIVCAMNIMNWRYQGTVSRGIVGDTKEERQYLAVVMDLLQKNLKVDARSVFMAGVATGGYHTAYFGEQMLGSLSGLIVIGAGRPLGNARPPGGLQDKPIFVAAGTQDAETLAKARQAAGFYRRNGANVTFEEWPDQGNAVPPESSKLGDWLARHGPMRHVAGEIERARAMEKAGRLGEALSAYAKLAALSQQDKASLDAAAAVEALTAKARQMLSDAKAAADADKPVEAAKGYSSVAASFKGSPFAEQADAALKELAGNPKAKAAIEQADIDAKADALEAQAVAAEKEARYDTALELYEEHVAGFPKAARHKQVADRLAALKGDKKITNALTEKQCTQWLTLARNYMGARMPDKAKPYLDKILKEHPGTKWAQEAQVLLRKCEEEY